MLLLPDGRSRLTRSCTAVIADQASSEIFLPPGIWQHTALGYGCCCCCCSLQSQEADDSPHPLELLAAPSQTQWGRPIALQIYAGRLSGGRTTDRDISARRMICGPQAAHYQALRARAPRVRRLRTASNGWNCCCNCCCHGQGCADIDRRSCCRLKSAAAAITRMKAPG